MRKLLFFLYIAPFICISTAAVSDEMPAKNAFTLKECYQLALKRSETIAIQEEIIKEAQARFRQAFSTILPRASFVLSETFRDDHDTLPEKKFTFSQPLFSGFKEFASMSASKAQQRQRAFELERAKQILFVDVSDAFYFFLTFQDDLETLETIRTALKERVNELKERESLGRSRLSEVVNAQAQLSRTEAEIQEVLSESEIARQLLEFLIGVPIEYVIDENSNTIALDPLEKYLPRTDDRLDVQAAYENWQVAKNQIRIAGADAWPAVSAEGNYYLEREGTNQDIDWDVGLTVDVPLFNGGQVSGLKNEAKVLARQAELRYELLHRQAELGIKNAYTRLAMSLKKTDAFSKAFDATRQNYELQLEDYRKNLVNNLEVLQALRDLQDAQRDFSTSRNETQRLYWNFKVAIGEI